MWPPQQPHDSRLSENQPQSSFQDSQQLHKGPAPPTSDSHSSSNAPVSSTVAGLQPGQHQDHLQSYHAPVPSAAVCPSPGQHQHPLGFFGQSTAPPQLHVHHQPSGMAVMAAMPAIQAPFFPPGLHAEESGFLSGQQAVPSILSSSEAFDAATIATALAGGSSLVPKLQVDSLLAQVSSRASLQQQALALQSSPAAAPTPLLGSVPSIDITRYLTNPHSRAVFALAGCTPNPAVSLIYSRAIISCRFNGLNVIHPNNPVMKVQQRQQLIAQLAAQQRAAAAAALAKAAVLEGMDSHAFRSSSSSYSHMDLVGSISMQNPGLSSVAGLGEWQKPAVKPEAVRPSSRHSICGPWSPEEILVRSPQPSDRQSMVLPGPMGQKRTSSGDDFVSMSPESRQSPTGSELGMPVKKRLRSQTLDAAEAIEIYLLRPSEVPPDSPSVNRASQLAQKYHVASNTIRDIWNRRSWVKSTRPYWTEKEEQEYKDNTKGLIQTYASFMQDAQ
mmetsp:Transcript_49169/g.76713  ORF Transcript_49169/g.76713 Transcript_49169/m.76713 type:complete len:500 (-) Transcript_49169:97-1596(-)|eukprot:CAMPEP_0184298922 /NCGR_PEP_ID=MMETSP1049-20130417/9637_1 /TAXON_ID=77928 /ORGANISM="Proteomonas sulcata, Strain CCMP704" /LENGTH=499 /DNA_ID=CAMNT_0026609203 /DNA_START=472 /DNA_END=1971 /DNA_ORIENTATION=+